MFHFYKYFFVLFYIIKFTSNIYKICNSFCQLAMLANKKVCKKLTVIVGDISCDTLLTGWLRVIYK